MVAAEAARRNVYLEINASPERLDLAARVIRAAKAKGCKFVISTDAHHPKHLANMTLRRPHGAARVAGGRRHSEHSARSRNSPSDPSHINQMKLISSNEITRTPIFHVTLDRAIDPDGFEIKRAIVQHGGSAVMMPVDDRGRILLVRQYRLPARAISVGTARRPRRRGRDAAAGGASGN